MHFSLDENVVLHLAMWNDQFISELHMLLLLQYKYVLPCKQHLKLGSLYNCISKSELPCGVSDNKKSSILDPFT